jgi:NADPH:quinone reductase-like Zn-dependent oxidoreductase
VARPTSVERARSAGADVVVPLDDDVDALTAALDQHGPFDVVLDPVFGTAATAAARLLGPAGRLVNLGGAGGDQATFSSAGLRSHSASVLGYTNNALNAEQRAEAITTVLRHAVGGTIRMAYDVRPASEVEQVWAAVAAGEATLRSVLDLT